MFDIWSLRESTFACLGLGEPTKPPPFRSLEQGGQSQYRLIDSKRYAGPRRPIERPSGFRQTLARASGAASGAATPFSLAPVEWATWKSPGACQESRFQVG